MHYFAVYGRIGGDTYLVNTFMVAGVQNGEEATGRKETAEFVLYFAGNTVDGIIGQTDKAGILKAALIFGSKISQAGSVP